MTTYAYVVSYLNSLRESHASMKRFAGCLEYMGFMRSGSENRTLTEHQLRLQHGGTLLTSRQNISDHHNTSSAFAKFQTTIGWHVTPKDFISKLPSACFLIRS